jgi:hypothetical protein
LPSISMSAPSGVEATLTLGTVALLVHTSAAGTADGVGVGGLVRSSDRKPTVLNRQLRLLWD